MKPPVTEPSHPIEQKVIVPSGCVDIAGYARIFTSPPSFNTRALIDGKTLSPGVRLTRLFRFIGGTERYPSYTFSYKQPVPVARVCIHLTGGAGTFVIRGDVEGKENFTELIAKVEGVKGVKDWVIIDTGDKPLYSLRIEGIEGSLRGYRSSFTFIDEVKIFASKEKVSPLLSDLQKKAVFKGPCYPRAGIPYVALERVDFKLPPAERKKEFGKMLTTDLWMFGINLKKDTSVIDYSKSESFRKVVQACRLVGFNSVMIFLEESWKNLVPWPSKVANGTDENILKALCDALHKEGLKVYVMPSSALSPPFAGGSLFIYPKEERPVRDLLRRRMLLVRQRTAHILSFQNLVARERGEQIGSNSIRKLWPAEVEPFFDDSRLALMGQTNIETIRFLTKHIHKIEKTVLAEAKLKSEYEKLLTVPGIGQILALTDMLETGDIHRFAKAGNYTSYCRCVKSSRSSNDKKKGENNRKNGNCYLNWMYVEAANFMRRYCPEAKRWHQRKAARSKQVVATKALASKICKACYFIMRDQKEFDVKMMFG